MKAPVRAEKRSKKSRPHSAKLTPEQRSRALAETSCLRDLQLFHQAIANELLNMASDEAHAALARLALEAASSHKDRGRRPLPEDRPPLPKSVILLDVPVYADNPKPARSALHLRESPRGAAIEVARADALQVIRYFSLAPDSGDPNAWAYYLQQDAIRIFWVTLPEPEIDMKAVLHTARQIQETDPEYIVGVWGPAASAKQAEIDGELWRQQRIIYASAVLDRDHMRVIARSPYELAKRWAEVVVGNQPVAPSESFERRYRSHLHARDICFDLARCR